jgi:Tfp pilus assembly protein PilF
MTTPTLLKKSLAALLLALAYLHAAPGQTAQVDMTDIISKEVEKSLIREYLATQRGERGDSGNSRERYRTASKTSIWRVS